MERIVSGEGIPAVIGPYSQAVVINNMVFVSGQLPMDTATGELELNDIKAATKNCLQNVGAVLKAANTDYDSVIKTTVFLADMADFSAMNEVYSEYFKNDKPARSCIQVAALPRGARVEIEVVAYC